MRSRGPGRGFELHRHAGHEAVSVPGGAEALAMLLLRKPALMILDVNMPHMSGLEVLSRIRTTTKPEDLSAADLIIEAATENEGLKVKILQNVDAESQCRCQLRPR